jgi:hypothetical protein
MSEHSLDDPVEPAATAEEHRADDTVESEETGARYRSDGSVSNTPEDELLLEEVEEEA